MLINIVLLSFQMFRYKIKVSDACRAWMKNPEMLENCSIGFHFPSQSGEMVQVFRLLLTIFFYINENLETLYSFNFSISWLQEKVLPLKLLHFYSADKSEPGTSFLQ